VCGARRFYLYRALNITLEGGAAPNGCSARVHEAAGRPSCRGSQVKSTRQDWSARLAS